MYGSSRILFWLIKAQFKLIIPEIEVYSKVGHYIPNTRTTCSFILFFIIEIKWQPPHHHLVRHFFASSASLQQELQIYTQVEK